MLSRQLSKPKQIQFYPAALNDVERLAALINGAYRGSKALNLSWSTEAHLLGGQRIDISMLTEQMQEQEKNQNGVIMLAARDGSDDALVGCVSIERMDETTSYLGMLTVDVDHQNQGYGDLILTAGEDFARSVFESSRMRMTVLLQRPELLEWYKRRGYIVTTERKPFPYGDERFGQPLVEGLEFILLEKNLLGAQAEKIPQPSIT